MPALERVEIGTRVAPRERQARDEMVEDEVVEHDDTRAAAERGHDPAVCLRIVADVVEGDVGLGRAAQSARAGLDDLEVVFQRGQEQRAVVGDTRPRRRQR